MKKILSFMLVLAMLAMMCINVAAAGNASGNFVGTHKGKNANDAAITDGVASFAPESTNTDIKATVSNAATANRYAVDLAYTVYDITINGTATWDVNQLKYVGEFTITTTGGATLTVDTEDPDATTTINVGTFSITNYSDLAVLASAEVDYPVDIPVSVAITDNTPTDIAATTATIAGAYNGTTDQSSNKAQTTDYTATMNSTDWANVAAILNNEAATQGETFSIATITITIKPANNAHAVDPDPSAGN